MRIKLLALVSGVGKAGDEVDVRPELGNELNCQGVAEVIAFDKADQRTASRLEEVPEPKPKKKEK